MMKNVMKITFVCKYLEKFIYNVGYIYIFESFGR